jgi:hypothetical protein
MCRNDTGARAEDRPNNVDAVAEHSRSQDSFSTADFYQERRDGI